jgi:hypothetical protein
MSIKKIFSEYLDKLNSSVQSSNKEDEILKVVPRIENTISFTFDGNDLEIVSTLSDEQLELMINLMVTEVGLEFLLSMIEFLDPEKFERVSNSIKSKTNVINNIIPTINHNVNFDNDEPLIPVVFKNEAN